MSEWAEVIKRSRPVSAMIGSNSESKRMLLGLMLPCTCFLSWMKAIPRAMPLAILSRALKERGFWEDVEDEPDFAVIISKEMRQRKPTIRLG